MKTNEQEFNERLEQLGNLYEEGKDKLHGLNSRITKQMEADYLRLYDILREMRDIAAVQLQKVHFVNEN